MPKQSQGCAAPAFLLKTPVMVFTGLCVSVVPALAIVAKNELSWFGVISGALLCVVCVGVPLLAREIADRLGEPYEAHRTNPVHLDSASGLDSDGLGDHHRSDANGGSCGGRVCDHNRWTG